MLIIFFGLDSHRDELYALGKSNLHNRFTGIFSQMSRLKSFSFCLAKLEAKIMLRYRVTHTKQKNGHHQKSNNFQTFI